MKLFLLTIGLYNSDRGVWFDDIIIKGKQIPDDLDLIRVLKSKYFSKVIGVTSIKEWPNIYYLNKEIVKINENIE